VRHLRVVRGVRRRRSAESLVRHLRVVRGVRRRRSAGVSVMIETAPGAEFQFDWSERLSRNFMQRDVAIR